MQWFCLSGYTASLWIMVFLQQYGVCTFEKELRLLGLQAMTGKSWPGGGPCLVAVQMARDDINAHPDLLHGYELVYDYVDHEVNSVCLTVQKTIYRTNLDILAYLETYIIGILKCIHTKIRSFALCTYLC